jgi:hypothetical protein
MSDAAGRDYHALMRAKVLSSLSRLAMNSGG